jgi:tRNA(fMet)-specific endonuclease VapC
MSVTYLLDTNTLSYIAKGTSPAARARLQTLAPSAIVCISAVTEAEIRYGLARPPISAAVRAAIEALLLKVRILPWGSDEAVAYGDLRVRLESAGTGLSVLDTMIGAHAIAIHAVLVTNDKAFSRVPGMAAVENWTVDV